MSREESPSSMLDFGVVSSQRYPSTTFNNSSVGSTAALALILVLALVDLILEMNWLWLWCCLRHVGRRSDFRSTDVAQISLDDIRHNVGSTAALALMLASLVKSKNSVSMLLWICLLDIFVCARVERVACRLLLFACTGGFAVVFLDSVGYGLGLGKNNITYNHCFKRSIKL